MNARRCAHSFAHLDFALKRRAVRLLWERLHNGYTSKGRACFSSRGKIDKSGAHGCRAEAAAVSQVEEIGQTRLMRCNREAILSIRIEAIGRKPAANLVTG